MAALAEMLRLNLDKDARIIIVALEGIENILKAGDLKYGSAEANPFVEFCSKAAIPNVLEALQDLEDESEWGSGGRKEVWTTRVSPE